jgi:hypothetical protein
LCLIEKDADILAMMQVVPEERNLHIMVDHGDFVRTLRDHVVVPIPSRYRSNQMEAENPQACPSTENEDVGQGIEAEVQIEVQRSSSTRGKNVVCEEEEDGEGDDGEEGDGDTDTDIEFHDSDYDAEDGDDNLFLEYTDRDVNDNNELAVIVEEEDDAGLEHDDLNLTMEQQKLLKYKFKEFNPEVDMETPVFKTNMVFSCMAEFRKALGVYSVNERVKVRKVRNEATRQTSEKH